MIQSGKHLGLLVGIVLDRNDPEKLGRVRVSFPTLGGVESDWARVVVPYSGYQWIPEVGDEVVLAFDQGDPKIAVVLGTTHSEKNKPPSEEKDERVIEISDVADKESVEIRTASGQAITIDEKAKTITIHANQGVAIVAQEIALGAAGAEDPAVLGKELKKLLSDLFKVLSDLTSSFKTHVHNATALGAPTTPPKIGVPLPDSLLPDPPQLREDLEKITSTVVKLSG